MLQTDWEGDLFVNVSRLWGERTAALMIRAWADWLVGWTSHSPRQQYGSARIQGHAGARPHGHHSSHCCCHTSSDNGHLSHVGAILRWSASPWSVITLHPSTPALRISLYLCH